MDLLFELLGSAFMLFLLFVLLAFNRFISYMLAPEDVVGFQLNRILFAFSIFFSAGLIVFSIEPMYTLIPEIAEAHLVRILLVFTLYTFYLIMVNLVLEALFVLVSPKFRTWRKSRKV